MNNIKLFFLVNNQEVINKTRTSTLVVAKSENLYYAQFIFSELWDGLVKHVQFSKKGVDTADVLLVNDCTLVPGSMLQTPGVITVSVYGGALITTISAEIQVEASGYDPAGAEPPAPQPLFAYVQTPAATGEVQYIKCENGVLKYYNGSVWVSLPGAYQSAVEGGYTGTEAEFMEELSALPSYAASAATSAAAAAASAAEQVTAQKIEAGAVTSAKIAGGAVETSKLAPYAVTPSKLSFETYTKAEEDNRFSNALLKTAANTLGSTLSISDGVVGTRLTSLKLLGYCTQASTPSLTHSVEINGNAKSYIVFNSSIYGEISSLVPARAKYGLGNIKDENDFVSGVKIQRIAFKTLKGTAEDGTWAAHGAPVNGKYCYKLKNADIAMLPSIYGNYVICTHFTNSGRSIYLNSSDCGIGTVSCTANTDVSANMNSLFFVVGSSITGENGVTYDTTTLAGFLSWVAGQYTGYPIEVCYVKASPVTTQEPGEVITLLQTNTINAGSSGTFEVTYNQDVNKKIAELEAVIASIQAGI